MVSGVGLKWLAGDQALLSNLFVGLSVKRKLGVTESGLLTNV